MGRIHNQNRFLEKLKEAQGIIVYACELTGISRKTYYNWINKDPQFREKCEEIQETTLDKVEYKLLQKINSDDLTAIIFYLKTKGKKRGYVEKSENEVSINAFEKLMQELPDEV